MGSEEQNVQLETKILNVLLKSKLLKDEYNIQADHLKEYATRIGRMMGDECKKISGKQKSIKFDSRMMRTALVTFLEDGRKGLNKLRERSIECVPSLRTVQREYAHIRVGESWHCPLYCAMFYDVLADIGALKDRTTPVQLMFDEIKLKCGIWFNCTTNDIYGLTPTKNATSLNFAEEIEAMAEQCITEDNESPNVGPIDNLDDVCVNLDDEETSYVGAASKANVFRARTGKNQSWNIAYFLNCGSLDGDTIVKQILHVITCCEMAGLSVQGFVSDAGPNNVRAFTLITRGKCLKLCKGLLKKDSVSFRNPLTPEELIFIILCLVHGLKNMRNQFFIGRAPPEGKRKLVNNGNQIKWENITDLYDLVVSNQIESRCVRELPKLTFQAVDLDKWSKMNVHYAKVIFTDDTINYQLNVLRQKLGLNSNFFDNIIQEYCVKIGFEAELLLDKISLLMEVVFADGSQVAKELKDMMAQIEFSGYVHFIFIARFLNKRAHLTLGREVREFRMTDGKIHLSLNIKSERKAMEKCITYFDKWKVWMMGEEPRTWVVQKKHQLFVAHITYRNLKVAITGFLEYAENLLSKNTSIVFVPFLHSNQSSIEAFFSFMRSLSRDNARDISKALTTSNIQSDVKMASKKSTCYSNDDISNENETLKKAPYDSTTGPKRREEWLNEQIKKRDLEIVPNLGTKVLIFPKDVAADDSVRQFMNMVGTEETTESYSSLLLKTHSFREFAKLSSIGPARSWFENVMNGKQEGHFDTLCQQINWKLVNMLAKAGDAKSGAKNNDEKKAVSYQFQIWELVEKKDLEGLVSDTCPIGDRMGVIALIQILDEAIEQKLWAGMIERAELLRKNSNKEKPFHYRDVNSIFGWAVFHARKAKMKERFRRNDDEEKYAELTKEIEFLSAMRMYKSEAALSDHYLENCYHDTMRTSDRGHMTLVREEFLEFGYMLMDSLSSSVTEGKLLSKMEVLRLEKEAILNNTPLWEMWKVSSEKVQCVTEGDRKKMFEYVVKKTVHTKFEDVFKGLRGKLTSRGTKHNISGLSFRGEMKGMDRKKTVRTK